MNHTGIATSDWVRHMESILEELKRGMVILDDQFRVVFANEALVRLGLYERGEMQGRTPDEIFSPEDIPYILQQRESGHRNANHRTEFYLPRKNGEKIPAIFSGRAIHGPDGQEYEVFVVTDISAQKPSHGL
jgi:PAS domain S-box-containing protein